MHRSNEIKQLSARMGRSCALAFVCASAMTLAAPASVQAGNDEPLIIRNAKIYTVNEQQPWAKAMAIDANGVITAVGSEESVRTVAPSGTQEINLKGRMVLPGFQDVHLHALEAGINEALCEFGPEETLADLKWLIRDCRKKTPGNGWIVGAGVNMTVLLERIRNPIALIDSIERKRPVLILDDLGHGAWANSKALKLVGYDKLKADPQGGIILRHRKTNRPNGVVLENAQQKLRDAAYAPTKKNNARALRSLIKAQATLSANGITSVSDAGGYWPQQHPEIWQLAAKQNKLTVRAHNALYVYPDRPFDQQLKELKQRYSNDPNSLVRFNHAKIYVDGILSQTTAALHKRYRPGFGLEKGEEHGFLYFKTPTMNRYAKALAKAGFQLHFHTTGDRGATLALDAIEQAGRSTGSGPHRITHLYLVDEKDHRRFAELGVVADLQLAPSSVNRENYRFMRQLIGKRANNLMPIRSLLKAGAPIVLSSDWDADTLSPLVKLQTVLARRGKQSVPDLATALKMLTINPARALNQADKTGSIEVGKFADIVVLSKNLFDVSPKRLGKVRVRATLLQGDAVYDPKGLFR